jgi:hypothetical protein
MFMIEYRSIGWWYWLPCIGTWAQIIFGYCGVARMVSLLPWNRSEPLTNVFPYR